MDWQWWDNGLFCSSWCIFHLNGRLSQMGKWTHIPNSKGTRISGNWLQVSQNPSLGSDCSNFKTKYSYCIEANNEPASLNWQQQSHWRPRNSNPQLARALPQPKLEWLPIAIDSTSYHRGRHAKPSAIKTASRSPNSLYRIQPLAQTAQVFGLALMLAFM
jgi:hypothetical protein